MFYRFNAHRATKPQPNDSKTDSIARKIAGNISRVQCYWATIMDKYARRLPHKWLKALLIALALGSGSYCTYLFEDGIFSHVASRVEKIEFRRLWPFGQSGEKEKLQKQSAFARYLDSLEREVKRDSLENPQYYKP
ncbi:hypothetical protein [Dyadobacter frigoris]|uniref:Uncharacterized protein n=1 Tax=Dyadobacter frigoris TaxID=2576211 RepID=A0A4U6CRC4_9BACT|nr:hypothetical protein [Dyadobacter frigoris]TKT86017.1 hypothetical protein FDK13_32990 [Dyadobacter frigoris]